MKLLGLLCVLLLTTSSLSGQQLQPDELLVASRDTDEILRYSRTTGQFVDAFVPAGSGGLTAPTAIRFGPDGDLYVTSPGTRQILRFDGDDGSYIGAVVSYPSLGLFVPFSFDFGPDGNLYVGGVPTVGTLAIVRHDLQGGSTSNIIYWTDDPSGFLMDVEFGPDSLLYVSSFWFGVTRVDPIVGGIVDTLVPFQTPWPGDPLGLGSIEFGPDGLLYAHTHAGRQVKRYNRNSGAFIDVFVGAQLISPSGNSVRSGGLVFDETGDWYVSIPSGPNGNRIGHYDRATGLLVRLLDSSNLAGLEGPSCIALPPRLATAADCGGNPAGSLPTVSGLPRLGTTFSLGVNDPTGSTTPGSPAMLLISRQRVGTYPCGLSLPGFGLGGAVGELVVNLVAPDPLDVLVSTSVWTDPGSPVAFNVTVPLEASLVGRDFFVQGALFDVGGSSGARFGLAEGVSVRITL